MDRLLDSYIFPKILSPVLTFFIDVFQGILFIVASGEVSNARKLYVQIFSMYVRKFEHSNNEIT